MRNLLIVGTALLALMATHARAAGPAISCMDANGSTFPASPQHPCPVGAGPYVGNGGLSLTTVSVLLNTLTVATGATFPTRFGPLQIRNIGSTDVAICPMGGTCTCPENGVAATNGITVQAQQFASFLFNNIAAATPSIVACSGTPTVEVYW